MINSSLGEGERLRTLVTTRVYYRWIARAHFDAMDSWDGYTEGWNR